MIERSDSLSIKHEARRQVAQPIISLSAAEAKQIALAAHGFGQSKSFSPESIVDNLNVLQIDSVNVFSRSHYMPAFSRVGQYDRNSFDNLLWHENKYTEYWAHEAAFIPITDRHLFGWRMHDYRAKFNKNGKAQKLKKTVDRVRDQLRSEGPSFVKDLELGSRSTRGPWWDWSETKQAVEQLFATGEVVSNGRSNFVRQYALADVLPVSALQETPRDQAQDALIERASIALGVATLADLADYFRIKPAEAKAAVARLQEQTVLMPVVVDGWIDAKGQTLGAWMHTSTLLELEQTGVDPLAPNALLTPFDPVCWFRPRAERIFDFHYRIEIYTPKEKRKFGYYCLPLMVDGNLVGRIDLKADRANETLMVQSAWKEPGAPKHTAKVAKSLLAQASKWQGLNNMVATGAGNLKLGIKLLSG